MAKYTEAGADAAGAYDEKFKQIIANDPDIQRVIQGVWGTGPRPSDTPEHLEKANAAASKQITQILAQKGIPLPERTFVNPRSGALEGHRGWSGLSGIQKAAIIAAAAATGVGGLAMAGALGGGAAAGAAGGAAASGAGAGTAGTIGGLGAGLGVSAGAPAALGTVGATGLGLGGTAMGGSAINGMLLNAGLNAAKTKATGGSWKDAALSGGTGALTGGLSGGGGMDWSSILKNYGKEVATNAGSSMMQKMMDGRTLSAAGQGLGAISQTAAHNRGAALEAMLAGDEMQLAADRERRAAESDILKNMQIANYIKGGGFKDAGPGTSVSGKPLGQFDFGVRPSTESEMQMATELEGQLADRLKNPRQLRDYDSKMEPGKLESTLGWLSPILSTVGAARTPNQYEAFMKMVGNQATPTPQAPAVNIQGGSFTDPTAAWGTGFEPAKPRQSGNPYERITF